MLARKGKRLAQQEKIAHKIEIIGQSFNPKEKAMVSEVKQFAGGLMLLLLSTLLFAGCNGNNGSTEAERDIKDNILKLKTHGLRGEADKEYANLLRIHCNTEVEYVAEEIRPARAKEISQYNQVMKQAIEKRYGVGVLDKLYQQALLNVARRSAGEQPSTFSLSPDLLKFFPAPPPLDKLEEQIQQATQRVEQFWQDISKEKGFPYDKPRVETLTASQQTPCGAFDPTSNCVYCPQNHTVYLGKPFLARLQSLAAAACSSDGDFAVAFVVAHEWGHSAQRKLTFFSSKAQELQADWLAGVFANYCEKKGYLQKDDLAEMKAITGKIGENWYVDDLKTLLLTPWFRSNIHGTPEERLNSFMRGYQEGM